ncbi:phage baseplate plug family protein [Lentilactobacillus hilgardii]|uniref:phage baseplate plug family protein n=1 Tax=Lentilactobacillus hilgardii TaxID=1588 RepID=UPI003FA5EDDF
MSLRDKLMVDMSDLPNYVILPIGTENFTIEFYYRERYDTLYFNLYDSDDTPLIMGEKLVYGMPLWNINDADLPSERIVPLDEAGVEDAVSIDNFQSSVFLYFDDLDPEIENPDNVDQDDPDSDNSDLLDDDSGSSLIEDEPVMDNNEFALPSDWSDTK